MGKHMRDRILVTGMILVLALGLLMAATTKAATESTTEHEDMFLKDKVALTKEEQAYLKKNPKVVMAVDASWSPLEYLNESKQYKGVISGITSKIGSYTGLQIEYRVMDSYADALKEVRSGKADMVSGLAYDEDMAKAYNVRLSSPFLTINSAVVSNKEIKNLYQGTKHKKIAVVADDYSNEDIKKTISNCELIECSSNEECLKMVSNNKVDMAIIASYCAEHYLSYPKYSEFQSHSLPDFNWDLSYGISKKTDPLLVSILNKGIKEISQVDINDAVYKGIMEAEYNNQVIEFIYRHPLFVIGMIMAVVLLIAVLVFIIIWSRKREQTRKINEGTRLRLALERTSLCIWELDITTKKIIKVDNEHEKHGFYDLRENIPESALEQGYIHPDDISKVREVLRRVGEGEQDVQSSWRVKDLSIQGEDSVYWWEQVLIHIVYDDHHRAMRAIGVSEDVTKEKNAQRDALTSVYNRSRFEQKSMLVLEERRNSHLQCAYLILDLDGFKKINDTYGHETGDRVLISVGATLNKTFRSSDIVGRLGGDEFTVFMTSIASQEDVEKKAEELVTNIREISKNEGYPFEISCSVGVSIVEKGTEDLASMYKKADLALYEVKNAGKNRYQIYGVVVKKKILVVDDIEMNRALLRKILEAEYEILEAANGKEALDILAENGDINMVITDIMMPVMDGIELIKCIRENHQYQDIAIIAETQYGDAKLEKKIISLNVDDFVNKAASPGVIQMRVRNIMKIIEF